MSQIKALLFDVFGTVVDWRTGVSLVTSKIQKKYKIEFDSFEFADAWRAEYQPAMEEVRSGRREFIILDQLHRENLKKILKKYKLDIITKEDEDRLVKSWHELPGWPDSSAGLKKLKEKFIIASQSNGNVALIVNMAKHSDLPWDMVLGAEVVRYYKPTPESYKIACAMLGLNTNQCMMVAAHNNDLKAAQDQGLKTAFVLRESEHGPLQTTDLIADYNWDYICEDLIDLANKLDDIELNQEKLN